MWQRYFFLWQRSFFNMAKILFRRWLLVAWPPRYLCGSLAIPLHRSVLIWTKNTFPTNIYRKEWWSCASLPMSMATPTSLMISTRWQAQRFCFTNAISFTFHTFALNLQQCALNLNCTDNLQAEEADDGFLLRSLANRHRSHPHRILGPV